MGNKIFKKLAGLFLGLTMALGVGAALNSNKKGLETKAEEVAYAIEFKDTGSTDGNDAKTATADIISSGDTYMTVSSASNIYQGKSGFGIKGGNSSKKGSITLGATSAGAVKATKLVVNACYYGSDGKDLKVSVNNGTAVTLDLTDSLNDFVVSLDGTDNISSVLLEASAASNARFYLKSITVYVSGSVPPTPATEYTVDFDLQGHGSSISSQTIEEGSFVVEPTAPTDSNYKFIGWYKEAGCTNAWNFLTDTVNADTTLYAKWVEKIVISGDPISIDNGDSCTNSIVKIDGIDNNCVKVGASKKIGTFSFDITAGAETLYFRAAAYNADGNTTLTASGISNIDDVVVAADSGISGNSPYTLAGNPDDYIIEVPLPTIYVDTTLTFSTQTSIRVLIWDAHLVSGSAPTKEVISVLSVDLANSKTVVSQNGTIAGSEVTLNVMYNVNNLTGTEKANHVNVVTSVLGEVTATAWYTVAETNDDMKATFTVTVVSKMSEVLAIASNNTSEPAENNFEDVDGTVIGTAGSTFFIQDGLYGLMAYSSGHSFAVGDRINASEGKAFLYSGCPEIKGTFAKTGTATITPAVITTKSEFDSTALNTLISVEGIKTNQLISSWSSSNNVTITGTLGDQSITIYLDKFAYNSTVAETLGQITVNEEFNINNAVHCIYNSTHQIRFTSETTVERLSSRELISIAATVASGTYYAGDVLSASDFDVTATYSQAPAEETINSGFTWTVNGVENGALVEGSNTIVVSYNGKTSSINLTAQAALSYVAFDLTIDSYENDVTDELITWKTADVTITNAKGTGTKVTNYIPTEKTSTRFYKNNTLTITPSVSQTILKIVFTATSSGYADVLKGSYWTNANAVANNTDVEVTPANGSSTITCAVTGTCGFSLIKVYFASIVPPTPDDDFFVSGLMDNNSLFVDDIGEIVVNAPTGADSLSIVTDEGNNFVWDQYGIVDNLDGTFTIPYLAGSVAGSFEVSFFFVENYTLDRSVAKTINLINPNGLSDARGFINTYFDDVCEDGVTIYDEDTWASTATAYSQLSADAKAFLTSAEFDVSGVGVSTQVKAHVGTHYEIADGMSKYDAIVAKYAWATDFMSRGSASARRTTTINLFKNVEITWIIAVISLVGVSAIGGYFFYKSRKEEF